MLHVSDRLPVRRLRNPWILRPPPLIHVGRACARMRGGGTPACTVACKFARMAGWHPEGVSVTGWCARASVRAGAGLPLLQGTRPLANPHGVREGPMQLWIKSYERAGQMVKCNCG